MNKSGEAKSRKRSRINKDLFKYVPLLFVVGGLILFGCGAVKLHKINAEIGDESIEQLAEDIPALNEEYEKVSKEADTEYAAKGLSDRYLELNEQATQIKIKISEKTNSRYVKETGKGNPDSIGDIFALVPVIPIGMVVVILGVILQVVITKEKK
jgi:hypothetical protein